MSQTQDYLDDCNSKLSMSNIEHINSFSKSLNVINNVSVLCNMSFPSKLMSFPSKVMSFPSKVMSFPSKVMSYLDICDIGGYNSLP